MAGVKIGGIVFTDFYYLDRDKKNAEDWGLGNGTCSYNTTAIQVPNITRLNVRWTNEDNVGMYIELGVGQQWGNVEWGWDDGVELRHAYGWWEVNSNLKLTAGKTTTPFSPLHPSQLLGTRSGSYNVIGAGFGDIYPSRVAQVRGTYKFNKTVKLALALVDPNGVADVVGDKGPWSSRVEYSTKIPRVDIGVPITLSWIKFYPSLMWQRRTVDNLRQSDYAKEHGYPTDDAMTTYVASLGFKTGYGPLSFSAEGNWGKNWGNAAGFMGYTYPAIFSSAGYKDGNINDADSHSFWLDLSYKVGIATPHLMYGEMKTSNAYGDIDLDSKASMYGVSCPIEIAKGFSIRPEVMFYDEGIVQVRGSEEEDYDAGKYMIAGVQFQITF
ncbi:MAG: hypothetical protein U9P50_00175 [Patescibacteria group bacterium]|nr:hypothetical protein [Patescibacteria group bacterium]